MYLVSGVHRTTYWEILHPDWLRWHNQLVDEGSVTQNLNQQFVG